MTSVIDITSVQEYFTQHDPRMSALLHRSLNAPDPLTIPTLKPAEEYFANIVSSIISQQISTKAAAAVKSRVVNFLGELTPEQIHKTDFDELKRCGLSNQKTKYLKHNAAVWHEIPYGNFAHMTDEEVINELTKLYGIGRWTAEMFLIFSLARPDVFSYGDHGLMQSLYRNYGYKPHYTCKIHETVTNWSPFRTIASLTLWHSIDSDPILL